MLDFRVHNFPFLEFLMQIFDVLGMQISPFKGTRQEKYLNPKPISFQIMKCVLIWSVRGKVGSKTWIFWNFIIDKCYVG